MQKEKEIWERRGDDPGPKPTVTAQSLHPESIMKMTPHPAERSESTASHIVRGCKKREKSIRKGHLAPMQTPLRKLKVQRDSLVTTTAALVEAVRTAEGGLWEAPKGLRREDLAARVEGQKVRVRELKESIKRQRAGPVPRGDTQRKQDGPNNRSRSGQKSPARR